MLVVSTMGGCKVPLSTVAERSIERIVARRTRSTVGLAFATAEHAVLPVPLLLAKVFLG